jgi:hypothetical protein
VIESVGIIGLVTQFVISRRQGNHDVHFPVLARTARMSGLGLFHPPYRRTFVGVFGHPVVKRRKRNRGQACDFAILILRVCSDRIDASIASCPRFDPTDSISPLETVSVFGAE